MARFLSAEWLEELQAVIESADGEQRAEPPPSRDSLSVRQVVTGGPEGNTSFVMRTGGGATSLDLHGHEQADVEIRQDLATAVEIATGKLSPSAAFASGRIKLTGRVGLLVKHQEVLASFGDPFSALRSNTTY